VKQIIVASCSSVTCWYMVPLVCSRYPHQCKKHSASTVSVGKWWPYWTTELVDKERGVCCYPNHLGTKHRTPKRPQTDCGCICKSNMFVTGIDEMVRADGYLSRKPLRAGI